jgi:hypothetical protein
METQKNDEKNIVLELKRQLGRMMVQVDYMYRNDREMSRLDLDILMEHTRDLYDLLCDYQADTICIPSADEEIKHDVELEIDEPEEMVKEPDINGENDGDEKAYYFEQEEKKEDVVDNEPIEEEKPEVTKHVLEVDEDDFDDEDWEDEEDETFHVEPINVDDFEDSPMLIPPQEENVVKPQTEPEPEFVLEDNSLAARLQRAHVSDIRMAIGINDKVMIVNDLFNGSVERYNKSIDALNDFPTLSGARVYMSELQIELQWDTESFAYKMLNDLVERRFV